VRLRAVSHLEVTRCNVKSDFVLEHRELVTRVLALAQLQKLVEGFQGKLVIMAVELVVAEQENKGFVFCLMQVEIFEEFFL